MRARNEFFSGGLCVCFVASSSGIRLTGCFFPFSLSSASFPAAPLSTVCACDSRSHRPELVVCYRLAPPRWLVGDLRRSTQEAELYCLMSGWLNVLPVPSSAWSPRVFEWQRTNCISAPRTTRKHHHHHHYSPVVRVRCELDDV